MQNRPPFYKYPQPYTPFNQISTKYQNPNKTLAWSSINDQNYQQIISPLDYKVSNPSSSLIMLSLSQNDIESTNSSTVQQPYNNINEFNNIKYQMRKQNHKRKCSQNNSTNNHTESNELSYPFTPQTIGHHQKSKTPPSFSTGFMNLQDNYPVALNDYRSNNSMEQSLHHLEQSQEELMFLKSKLQQAYEKLEKEILNSYDLEEKIETLKVQLQAKDQFIQLEKTENQKLKFTLKAIMKNKSLLEEQIQKGQNQAKIKNSPKDSPSSESQRQHHLKQTLKLKLELKQLQQSSSILQKSHQELTQKLKQSQENLKLSEDQINKLKAEMKKKDRYLENLAQDLSQIQQLRTQNKKLLVKQSQYLQKMNTLQNQLRKVTDQKVTSIARLKHEIALGQKHNEELLQQLQQLTHQNNLSAKRSIMLSNSNNYSQQQPHVFNAYSPQRQNQNRSVGKYSALQSKVSMTQVRPTQIFEDEDEFVAGNSFTGEQVKREDSLNNIVMNTNTQRRRSQHSMDGNNKQNVNTNNMQQSNNETDKTSKSVGKWKRPQFQSFSNNSSYFQSTSHQQPQQIPTNKQPPQPTQPNIPNKQIQTLINNKLATNQSQDQKLSKYQIHRKNLQNQLSALQKIKRPTKEQRQKIQKLEKQLFYIDSDIAGLKRKIRRKY